MRLLWVLLITFMVSACASTLPMPAMARLSLDVQPLSLSPGGSLELVLSNGSSAAAGYNLCSSGLERRVGEGWEPVPSERACTMELRILEPGCQARYTLQLPRSIAPGEYRYMTRVEDVEKGTHEIVRSVLFRVMDNRK
jgi:hypothetical protein